MDIWKATWEFIKSSPWWLVAGLFVPLWIWTYEAPNSVPDPWKLIIIYSPAVLIFIGFFKIIDWLIKFTTKPKAETQFYVTPQEQQCYWSCTQQQDKSWILSFVTRCVVKNKRDVPLLLLKARIVKPRIRGEMFQTLILPRAEHDMAVPPFSAAPFLVSMDTKVAKDHKRGHVKAILELTNDEGHSETTKVTYKDPFINGKPTPESVRS
jgi:hypothetical protein